MLTYILCKEDKKPEIKSSKKKAKKVYTTLASSHTYGFSNMSQSGVYT